MIDLELVQPIWGILSPYYEENQPTGRSAIDVICATTRFNTTMFAPWHVPVAFVQFGLKEIDERAARQWIFSSNNEDILTALGEVTFQLASPIETLNHIWPMLISHRQKLLTPRPTTAIVQELTRFKEIVTNTAAIIAHNVDPKQPINSWWCSQVEKWFGQWFITWPQFLSFQTDMWQKGKHQSPTAKIDTAIANIRRRLIAFGIDEAQVDLFKLAVQIICQIIINDISELDHSQTTRVGFTTQEKWLIMSAPFWHVEVLQFWFNTPTQLNLTFPFTPRP